ncbi:MAG: phosphatase PAP2 family protein [Vicinamibacterales bacterium]
MGFDLTLLTTVVQHRTPWLDDVMVFVSTIGNGGAVWVTLGFIGLIFTERRPASWRLLLTLFCTYLVVELALKGLIGRERPFNTLPNLQLIADRPLSSSFPSAHAALGFAGAIAGSRVVPTAGWILWPLAVLVAASRVYLGVHWPTDVVFGSLMGCACAWFVLGGKQSALSA